MKIAFILPSLVSEGPIVVVHSLVLNLIDKVEAVHVYYFDDKDGLDFPCPIYKISMKEPIEFDSYDVIHSNCLRPDMYLAKWIKKSKVKNSLTVSTLHQDTFKTFSYQYNKLLTYLFSNYWLSQQSKMDVVVSISNQLRDSYSKYFNQLTTIYNGCSINKDISSLDKNLIKDIQVLKFNYKMLGAYALVTKRKGIIQVLKFLKQNPDYAFVLIGEGPDIKDLKEFVMQNGMQDRVLFHSFVMAPYNYLENIDVYVMPSYSEGFGLSMVEAAMMKKAIVCSDIHSFNEIFTSDEASFFELDNISSLQFAIYNSFENKDELGENAYLKAISHFTSEVMTYNYLKLYAENRIIN